MLDALNKIIEFISLLFDFVVQLVTGLGRLLILVPDAVVTLTQSINYVPNFVVAFATVTVTVAVIFLIVGRSSGGSK